MCVSTRRHARQPTTPSGVGRIVERGRVRLGGGGHVWRPSLCFCLLPAPLPTPRPSATAAAHLGPVEASAPSIRLHRVLRTTPCNILPLSPYTACIKRTYYISLPHVISTLLTCSAHVPTTLLICFRGCAPRSSPHRPRHRPRRLHCGQRGRSRVRGSRRQAM